MRQGSYMQLTTVSILTGIASGSVAFAALCVSKVAWTIGRAGQQESPKWFMSIKSWTTRWSWW